MSIKRNEGESFADFKERRIIDNENTRISLKPKLFWDSYYQGTYVNPNKQSRKNNTKHGRKQLAKGI